MIIPAFLWEFVVCMRSSIRRPAFPPALVNLDLCLTPPKGVLQRTTRTRHSIRPAVSYLTNAHGDWVEIEDQLFNLLNTDYYRKNFGVNSRPETMHANASHRRKAPRCPPAQQGDRTGVAASRSAGPPSPTVARFPLAHVRNVNRCGYYRSDGIICHCSWFRWVASRAVIAICSMACHLKLNT